jgi:hypothetical protein
MRLIFQLAVDAFRVVAFSLKNLPLIRILFMNRFSYKRTCLSLGLMYAVVEARKRMFYSWHKQALAERAEVRQAQSQAKVSRWAEQLAWLDSAGQTQALAQIPESTLLMAFLHPEDVPALLELPECAELRQAGVGLVLASPENGGQASPVPGVYLATLQESAPKGFFYGVEVEGEAVRLLYDSALTGRAEFRGVLRAFRKRLERRRGGGG